ncbi:pseudouridine synthase [Thalassomonas sp. M1454]|uniref:pseudouridine synthase n=1 Tax=Thalassomonas sp. M1454 TaxID=2594477 RepID=UPI00117C8F5E|nr:16S rRNA pseudouridine(516) synthase [Thalassomonas sp. M1454]TRX54460.1 16S rRNA pseudouridine(516) synthase [Thalassomonas sp. M1454]
MQRSRLDKFISQKLNVPKKQVRLMLAQKRVKVNGNVADSIDLIVDKFSVIECDGEILQANKASYIMLHKPIGVVSATKDDKHKTVIDLLDIKDYPEKHLLHIVGRLDLNTSGLILLTNDSSWSESLTLPENKVDKVYRVTLENPIASDELKQQYLSAFAKGMYFAYEDLTTKPATLQFISENEVLITLQEGKYHQIKRMFGRFQNPVIGLHRLSVGNLQLDSNLLVTQSRQLTACEVREISVK